MTSEQSSGAPVPSADVSEDGIGGTQGVQEAKDAATDFTGAEEFAESLLESTENLSLILRKAGGSSANENFTWEHFFTKHCGILHDDALKYETSLIAHRMDPLDTFLESFGLIIEYGRIPIGDKLKIAKTIKKKKKSLQENEQAKENARKSLGLEKYNERQASMILDLAGGDTQMHIDYGIERFKDAMLELEHMMNIAMIKDPKTVRLYNAGAAAAQQLYEPTFQLLSSFGYKTFEYTKDKVVQEPLVHGRPTSSHPVVENVLLGNMEEGVPENMYA